MTLQSMNREQSVSQIASVQGQTEESLTEVQREVVLLKGMSSLKYEPSAERIDNAATLCARDYKGLNNFGTNGVIEWK